MKPIRLILFGVAFSMLIFLAALVSTTVFIGIAVVLAKGFILLVGK